MAAGVGMFFRIPQVMPDIAQIKGFSGDILFKRFSLYLVGLILVWGGARKIWQNYKLLSGGTDKKPTEK